MLDYSEVNRLSALSEAVVRKQFEKLGYTVKKLDGPTKDSRPDFLISNSSGPQMLCEVKTIVSFGYMPDKGEHVSTLDVSTRDVTARDVPTWHKNLREFCKKIDLRKMDDVIADAVRQRSALISDEPKYSELPLLVAFDFDPLAEAFFHFYPERFNEDVSGILRIEPDVALSKAFGELPDEEQEPRLRTDDAAGLPANTKDFVLAPNKNAIRRVPKDFQLRCVMR
jgi:hypothetical protein